VLTVAGLAAVLTAMGGGSAGSGGTGWTAQTAAPAPPPDQHSAPDRAPDRTSTVAAAGTDAQASAKAWLQATQSVSYADPVPSAWIDRARPVVTARLATEYDRYRNSGRGAAWPGFVDDQCVTTATDIDSTIPPEAPRSDTIVSVQLAARLVTVCQRGDPAAHPAEDFAATLTLVRGRDRLWRVDQQIY
jgi:hypothetical protein